MSARNVDELASQLSKSAVLEESRGVSFKGQGLKLNNRNDSKDVVDAINDCKNLNFLDLEGNTLGVEAAQEIAEALKHKKELKRALWKDLFTGRMKSEIPKALTFLGDGLKFAGATLAELDLSDNAFGPIGIEALAAFLSSPVCFQLQELRLNNNGMGITGGKMLAESLLSCHMNSTAAGRPLSLKVFIAGRNRLENDGAAALSKVFETLGSLEEIQMPQNGIYYKGISKISEALVHNKNLKVLNLNDNTLTAKGAECLAAVLPHLQKLQVLNLGDCLLKNKGAIFIAEAISEQHADLEEVHLNGNEIRDIAGIALAQSLRNKKKLRKLCLNDNEFGSFGRKSLTQELLSFNKADTLECPSEDDREGSESEEQDSTEDEESDEDRLVTPMTLPHVVSPAAPLTTNNDNRPVIADQSPVGQFIYKPNCETFIKLNNIGPVAILNHFKDSPEMLDVEGFVGLIMRISDLKLDEPTKKLSLGLAVELYRILFQWAEDKKKSSIVNNVLFVFLGLIKDEDDKVRITWDVDCCINVLQTAIVEKIVPNFTQHILTCCLDRKFKKKQNVEEITVA